ncbi:hypothetical protein F511_42906 [Dorcoceras hygrometricum]|uniref:Serine/arginine repetitive matrix protein 1-like n=1 Tax=Dorcoceras hygrometricum TaxID=472368 RepID=A0A2Z7A6G9_9LAMI|nr:hypothetical protein F511_42906 [Dorcoceras hygrometricum]
MGCCVSTNASENNRKRTSKSPPPTHPLQEEEAVKEVLSETPTAPRLDSPNLSPDQKNLRNGDVPKKSFMVFGSEEASEEISEICSTVSESVSVSTSVTEKKDNYSREHDVVSKIRNRSPARAGNQSFSGDYKRDRPAGKSPYRRSEPSPGRTRAGPVTGSGRRKDGNEELPARRSRSPMMRADSGSVKPSSGRIQTARGAGKSPSRVVNGSGEKIRKLEEEAEDNREQQWPMTGNELLENPLVSLECFIFL